MVVTVVVVMVLVVVSSSSWPLLLLWFTSTLASVEAALVARVTELEVSPAPPSRVEEVGRDPDQDPAPGPAPG